jgi:protein-tyrosine-phosphatase
MEFQKLDSTNPFRLVIDQNSCASLGAPDYFDIIKTPMNLTYIQRKVESMAYTTLKALLYNTGADDPYRQAAEEMKKVYRKLRKKIVQSLKEQQARKK